MITPRKLWGGLGNEMFQHAFIYSQMKEGKIPDIYLQDEKYFKEFSDDIKAIYGLGVESINRVSIHVRRGDYVNNSFYVDLNQTDYYDRAIALFPDDKFLVFCADRQEGSDDIGDMEWCKERFQGNRFAFFQGKDEIEDMNKMASCKGHIMANSSFSWWASYLGGGKVVAPKEWFTDGVSRITLLDSWIKI
mgnify:CR=1 FL=1